MASGGTLTAGAAELAGMIRRGETSAAAAVEDHLRRMSEVNPVLNAVVQWRTDLAREEAAAADARLARGEPVGLLHGVPVTVKDCFGVAGMVCAVGTAGWAGRVLDHDDVAVARLRAAGAVVLGSTNCPELLVAYESDNLVYGRTSNPYDLERTSGGSSGGESAIVAAAGSSLGLGSDSAGSIRVPAHYCGLAALKPTLGRVPMTSDAYPVAGIGSRFRGVCPIARRVEDVALALSVLAGPDDRDAWAAPVPLADHRRVEMTALRAALFVDNGIAPCEAATVAAVEAAGAALEAAGVVVEALRPPGMEEAALLLDLWGADGGAGLERAIERAGTTAPSALLDGFLNLLRARAVPTAGLTALLARWDTWRSELRSFFAAYDLVVCPVAAGPAVPHGTSLSALLGFSYCWPFNLAGSPVATVRAGTAPGGLPLGVQLAAAPWREDVALAAARVVEASTGGWVAPLVERPPAGSLRRAPSAASS